MLLELRRAVPRLESPLRPHSPIDTVSHDSTWYQLELIACSLSHFIDLPPRAQISAGSFPHSIPQRAVMGDRIGHAWSGEGRLDLVVHDPSWKSCIGNSASLE